MAAVTTVTVQALRGVPYYDQMFGTLYAVCKRLSFGLQDDLKEGDNSVCDVLDRLNFSTDADTRKRVFDFTAKADADNYDWETMVLCLSGRNESSRMVENYSWAGSNMTYMELARRTRLTYYSLVMDTIYYNRCNCSAFSGTGEKTVVPVSGKERTLMILIVCALFALVIVATFCVVAVWCAATKGVDVLHLSL
ncbi:hypothetical protein TVAG_313630 [Trichomonas vaginalis G3]|uniref:Uncharacterized protein n=1 Tax=Trichomonas vaginalis (strain ATCC PRA-98 / G3) TaxID=412133 RepID=A2G6M4_TRIV3|nr:hypothetical protein TVAGG3_0396530 [Trichomonas vaginalis G3]EAX87190.1 hypothetical protein TVAG_313630 [Trichomonas vaginalis G3]KAI5534380.1 hypothetical protein TVAGG3_0396530 [Trichomonas vaginalis G3]|eukprot:XP_001300120.1 hypothetical protein [Trichomonas vaginalis G3]